MRVADVGGEEFEEPGARPVAGGGDQGGKLKGRRGQGGELVHARSIAGKKGMSA